MAINHSASKRSGSSIWISRREFIRLSALGLSAGLAASACNILTPSGADTTPTVHSAPTHPPDLHEASGAWSGTVRDKAGAGLTGARVTLFGEDGTFFRFARTTDDGSYALTDVPGGAFTLGVSAPGFEYVEAPQAGQGLDFKLGPESHPGRWSVIGDTEPEAFGGTNSAVFVPSGEIIYCHDTVRPIVFNPVSGAKRLASPSPSIQGCHMVTHLPDGRAFYVGGGGVDDAGNFDGNSVRTVKAYDAASDSWEVFPELTEKRWYPGLTPMVDGRFLVFGGGGQPEFLRIASCEIFDPVARTWTPTGSLSATGGFGPTVTLYNGEVFVAWWPPQVYSPEDGTWRNTALPRQTNRGERAPDLPAEGDHPDFSIIMLEDGRVAAIGVRRTAGENMLEIFDPETNTWEIGNNPEIIRSMPEVVRLPDGRILTAGGRNESGSHDVFVNAFEQTRLTDLYDPAAANWRVMAEMKNAREYHAVTLLAPDGRVITAAGTDRPGYEPPPSASKEIEAFEPPYLFRGPRPKIESISSGQLERGQSFNVRLGSTEPITDLVILGMNAMTHWMDGGPARRVRLPFRQEGNSLQVEVPADPAQAIPGWYFLFALVDDIPSEGVSLRIG